MDTKNDVIQDSKEGLLDITVVTDGTKEGTQDITVVIDGTKKFTLDITAVYWWQKRGHIRHRNCLSMTQQKAH